MEGLRDWELKLIERLIMLLERLEKYLERRTYTAPAGFGFKAKP
jgi:hypothetical protein